MLKAERLDQLTKREREILQLIVVGHSNKRIAETLSITIRTVKFHTNNIYIKLAVKTRAEAISLILHRTEIQTVFTEN